MMEPCRQCGSELPEGALACPHCGAIAVTDAGPQVPSYSLPRELELVVSTRPLTPPAQSPNARLLMVRGGTEGREFPITQDEALIGRWDPECGSYPQVDLSDEDTEAKISRKHARILRRDGNFQIEDLGSRNGTYLNRVTRLVPNQPHPLKDGDEIILGKLFLKFFTAPHPIT